MSQHHFFKSVEITNFRVFKHIKASKLRRLNIISGLNATGKSALLETLFLSVDLNNPACLIRPYQWRSIPLSGSDLPRLFPDKESSAIVRVQTSAGKHTIVMSLGRPSDGLVHSAAKGNIAGAMQHLNIPDIEGVNLVSTVDTFEKSFKRLFINQVGDEFNTTASHEGPQRAEIVAQYLGQSVKSSPSELSDKVSQITRSRRKDELVQHLRFISSSIDDVLVLQDGAVSQVYAVSDSEYIPLALMGAGIYASFEVIVAAMISRNGVIFMDEIDTLLHFSVVPKLWSLLATLSREQNVQIFAVTHSKEAILSATIGIDEAESSADFQYIRIDSNADNHLVTSYNLSDVRSAFDLNVEIRK